MPRLIPFAAVHFVQVSTAATVRIVSAMGTSVSVISLVPSPGLRIGRGRVTWAGTVPEVSRKMGIPITPVDTNTALTKMPH